MANQIAAEQLTEGKNIFIRGRLAFSRLASPIEGKELERSIAREVARGSKYITDKPHFKAHLHHAEVVHGDPSNPTIEEQYVAQKCFDSRTKPESGKNFQIESKGVLTLPIIAVELEGGKFEQDTSGKDLAPGLDVTLVLSTYLAKNTEKRSLSIEQVLVHEPIRYYQGRTSVDENELQARGIQFTSPPQAVQTADAQPTGPVPEEPVEPEQAGPSPQPTPAPVASGPPPAWAQTQPEPGQNKPLTQDEEIAQLRAQNAELQNAASAVGPAQPNPWNDDQGQPQQGGISYANA